MGLLGIANKGLDKMWRMNMAASTVVSRSLALDPKLAGATMRSSALRSAAAGAGLGGIYGGINNPDGNHVGGAFSGALKGGLLGGVGVGGGLGGLRQYGLRSSKTNLRTLEAMRLKASLRGYDGINSMRSRMNTSGAARGRWLPF